MQHNIVDIILKKRRKEVLTDSEIKFFVDGFTKGEIPDYQASALLMAICLNGMNEEETFSLTSAMLYSGDIIDLSSIKGIKADKHSTGGVADSTSLALTPALASLGLKVAKMSGPGLGFSGGTVDKLESIPGFSCAQTEERFAEIVNSCGGAIISSTTDVAPADKKLYALRDVTGTVDNVSLIASSIMSKKLASGSDVILLDVKFGSGAFMKTPNEAIELADVMVKIGTKFGKVVSALITSMEQPLGKRVGNSLELLNILEVLDGKKSRLYNEVRLVASKLLLMSNMTQSEEEANKMFDDAISSKKAKETLYQMVTLQGGDIEILKDPSKIVLGQTFEIKAHESGYVEKMNTENIGRAGVALGGGRVLKTDIIDDSVGIEMHVDIGNYVNKGDTVMTIFHNNKRGLDFALELLDSSLTIGQNPPPPHKIAYAFVDINGTHLY